MEPLGSAEPRLKNTDVMNCYMYLSTYRDNIIIFLNLSHKVHTEPLERRNAYSICAIIRSCEFVACSSAVIWYHLNTVLVLS